MQSHHRILTILNKFLDLIISVVHLAHRYPEVVDLLLRSIGCC